MEIVEDTCIKECAFFEKYMTDGKTCPFYFSTTWLNEKTDQPKIINDCTSKRSLILQIEAFNRMQGLQIDFEQQRNKNTGNTDVVLKMAQAFNKMMENLTANLQIPYENLVQIEEGEICDGKKEICEPAN